MTEGITHIIKNDSGVQALIGQNKEASKYKVYPGVSDQPEQWPYTVVKILSKVPFKCKGESPTRFTYNFVVISYHVIYLSCQQIDKAIFWALDNVTPGIYNGVNIRALTFENTVDDRLQISSGILHAKISTYEALVNEDQAT